MVFNSIEFLIFFPVVLLLYYLLPQRFRWILLLAASYWFYLSWNISLIFLIVFTTLVSYFSAILLEKAEKKTVKKLCLAVTLIVCLGVLFFYKYFNFLSSSVSSLIRFFGGTGDPFLLDLILPVGISFYTFQTLSYVIDVYRGTVPVERHFGYYALYVSFFPQLVAGPIERPENLIPQLRAEHRPEWRAIRSGLRKMLIGFFKKVVVADLLSSYVVRVYSAPADANGFTVLLATVLFSFQIYCDFSGYTDIAIGCSEIMGIRLMQNFDRPYTARSIKEFWSRWHISLSSWFKDYIYIPLGGNRVSKARNCLNIMIVFLVSGLWHGAAWTYVLWGALHGLYQVIGKFTIRPRDQLWKKLGVSTETGFVPVLRTVNTFLLTAFAWIFFRAGSISDLGILLGKLFTGWSFSAEFFASSLQSIGLDLTGLLTCVLSLILLSVMDRKKLDLENDGQAFDLRYACIVWIIAAAWILLLAGDGASTFIYFQF